MRAFATEPGGEAASVRTGPAMIGAIDVGNSALKVGWFEGSRSVRQERREGMAPAAAASWIAAELATHPVSAIAIASVVPAWREALSSLAASAPLGWAGEASLATVTRPAAEVSGLGADRWMGAEAAFGPGSAALVVATGTATTFTLVDGEGRIQGGAIAAGLGTSAAALAQVGAQLFAVPMEAPPRVVAKATRAALQSGLVLGHAALIEGMVARLAAEWGSPLRVVGTGGWGEVLAPRLTTPIAWDPLLVLRGLARAAERTWGGSAGA